MSLRPARFASALLLLSCVESGESGEPGKIDSPELWDERGGTVTPPAPPERCNGGDDDGDGLIDESDAVDAPVWYADMDADGLEDCDDPDIDGDGLPIDRGQVLLHPVQPPHRVGLRNRLPVQRIQHRRLAILVEALDRRAVRLGHLRHPAQAEKCPILAT